ncbi:pituitary adenylate cyclase-activating polypeptide type I receptor-like isoform X1 [Corythoichthys intestinalis]|uniref:pituitary adenylate cyclase-activating polypeptide type I receptor-like isoform X1 n=1 Tax=Corythoichthys intestinalis TaxID=161448 RepID=UPI0025A6253D|nr:pituitary adenylate cyclase-activating polypeptide type I receptor-like isoform X1 [Corythoichthys intestinalis]XP_061795215.1 pituitary adenylate cyclase-activating polypeptide type I receptor-like [Nerophis lumbriciformis]
MREIKRSDQGIFCKFQERFLLFLCLCVPMMEAIHPDCAIIAQHLRAREICSQARSREVQNQTAHGGCQTEWDEIGCWLRADVGQVVNVSCSDVFQHYSSGHGFVFRNCTASGWSDIFPPYEEVCAFRDDSSPETETSYLSTFRQVYTVGYATSLISLVTAVVVFTAFRKFHCTRNYIHINLFSSFILRASAVFIKDTVLFADETLDHCSVSTTACKSAVAFFQFSILANYFWLLVEGMYLQTLLALTFVSQRMYFWWYILIGWGLPSTILILWVLTRFFYDDRGCWDDTDNVAIWWIIKGPITASLLVNIVIFVNVIRILVQKLKSSAMSGNNDSGHFIKLAKSTLFLIPLFGMHYTVFAFLPENTGVAARLYIELGLGSFQGFVVALLYCFMNGEVQAELRRWLWKCHNQSQRTPAKRSLSQVSMGARGGLRRTPSTGIVSTV